MKKHFVLLLGLSALAGLWSCQQEVVVQDNPTYDPEKNTVTTQFILNISNTGGAPETKQSAATVQADGANFRGMQDVHILAYNLDYTGVNGKHYLYDVDDESSKATRDFDLGNMLKQDEVNATNGRRILEVALPLNTNAIMLYGRALRGSGSVDEVGSTVAAGSALNSSLEDVSFSLSSRIGANLANFQLFGDLMGRILTGIMNSGLELQTAARGYQVPATGVVDGRYKFWWPVDDTSKEFALTDAADSHTGYTFYSGTKIWKEYGDTYTTNPTSMKPLEEVMGEAYAQIMTLRTDGGKTELRAASSASVLRLTSDLYGILKRVRQATPTTPEEYIAQLLANEIIGKASLFFQVNSTTGTDRIEYRDVSEIMTAVSNFIPGKSATDYTAITNDYFYKESYEGGELKVVRKGFPLNLNMPMGSAVMTFIVPRDYPTPNSNPTAPDYPVVTYPTSIPAYGMGGGAFAIENYRYPAELMYYTNSHIRVSDNALSQNDYPGATANWYQDSYWTAWSGEETVKSTTRSVAVAKTVNYGSALMKTQVAFSAPTVSDNNGTIHTSEQDNSITVDSGAPKFAVTGVLIGGVCDQVGWDFLPVVPAGAEQADFGKMIYDNLGGTPVDIPVYNATKAYTSPMYTLTWDNYNKKLADNAQQKVYIALELVNNSGMDIWGELNLIRNGGTFYLVGELDPTTSTARARFTPTGSSDVSLDRPDFFYPPFDDSGKTVNAPRVFMQDYVTDVKLNFTPTSLKHAYLTMPDLRASQVSLGLSVDLTWQAGISFDIDLGTVTGGGA